MVEASGFRVTFAKSIRKVANMLAKATKHIVRTRGFCLGATLNERGVNLLLKPH
jgi:hypothetical protein